MNFVQIVFATFLLSCLAACAGGGKAAATVDNKNGHIGGDVTVTATGGAGGTVHVTPTLAIDPNAFKYLFPGKALTDSLTSDEIQKVSNYCKANAASCKGK